MAVWKSRILRSMETVWVQSVGRGGGSCRVVVGNCMYRGPDCVLVLASEALSVAFGRNRPDARIQDGLGACPIPVTFLMTVPTLE